MLIVLGWSCESGVWGVILNERREIIEDSNVLGYCARLQDDACRLFIPFSDSYAAGICNLGPKPPSERR